MKLIITGMAMMLMLQWIGLILLDFEEIGITLIVWGIKLFPLSITATIITICLKILWRQKKNEDN